MMLKVMERRVELREIYTYAQNALLNLDLVFPHQRVLKEFLPLPLSEEGE